MKYAFKVSHYKSSVTQCSVMQWQVVQCGEAKNVCTRCLGSDRLGAGEVSLDREAAALWQDAVATAQEAAQADQEGNLLTNLTTDLLKSKIRQEC